MAMLKHYSAQQTSGAQHEDCSVGIQSWSKYQADKARDDGETTFQEIKDPISPALYDVLLPTFIALGDIRLLSACSQCKDQNANES